MQDPYCLRCQPQVMGAVLDLLRQAALTLLIESNGVSDNPLVFTANDAGGNDEVLSGGNFHAEPVAFAADMIAMAICELGSLSERRIAMLVDPALSGLPAFLTPLPGLNSGFMIPQVTAAALVSENKQRAFPASVDSIPTSANQEDHVSMSAHAARRLTPMAENAAAIVGIEILAAAQGCDFHAPLKSSDDLERVRATVRKRVPRLEGDRYMSPRLRAATALVREGSLSPAWKPPCPRLSERSGERRLADNPTRAAPWCSPFPTPESKSPAISKPASSRLARPHGHRLVAGSLYELAAVRDATIVRTAISRTVIDVNRDPSGSSLYPGQRRPSFARRRRSTVSPSTRVARCPARPRSKDARHAGSCLITRPYQPSWSGYVKCTIEVVLYDGHSIRSSVPRLFDGILPHFNIGTNSGRSCAPELTAAVEAACDATSFSRVTNGRFRGGWITRHHGKPQAGVHAIQMELACRSYLTEPIGRVDETNWPPPFDELYAAPIRAALGEVLRACVQFAARMNRGALP